MVGSNVTYSIDDSPVSKYQLKQKYFSQNSNSNLSDCKYQNELRI